MQAKFYIVALGKIKKISRKRLMAGVPLHQQHLSKTATFPDQDDANSIHQHNHLDDAISVGNDHIQRNYCKMQIQCSRFGPQT